jgi:hypothetical protein
MVLLPERIRPELVRHLESLKDLHQQDLDRKYVGVFLVNASEQKYKNAAKEFIWQRFSPAKVLTVESKTGNSDVTICMKPICRRRSNRRGTRIEFYSGQQPIPFATVMPVIFFKPTTIFGRFKNCWVIATSGPPWFIPVW